MKTRIRRIQEWLCHIFSVLYIILKIKVSIFIAKRFSHNYITGQMILKCNVSNKNISLSYGQKYSYGSTWTRHLSFADSEQQLRSSLDLRLANRKPAGSLIWLSSGPVNQSEKCPTCLQRRLWEEHTASVRTPKSVSLTTKLVVNEIREDCFALSRGR